MMAGTSACTIPFTRPCILYHSRLGFTASPRSVRGFSNRHLGPAHSGIWARTVPYSLMLSQNVGDRFTFVPPLTHLLRIGTAQLVHADKFRCSFREQPVILIGRVFLQEPQYVQLF